MNLSRYNIVALAILSSIALSQVSVARAELVYEDDLDSSAGKIVEADKAERINESDDQAPQRSQHVSKNTNDSREQERKDISKSEMLRRQRTREELKNEDLLSQKLEELRLKDEMKRTDKLAKESLDISSNENTVVQSAPVVSEQRVGSAAMQNSSQLQSDAQNPLNNQMAFGPNGTPRYDNNGIKGSSELSVKDASQKEEEFNQRVGISLRGGMGNISDAIYNIQSKFAFGLGVSVDITDYIAFVGGWTYSQYTLGASNGILSVPYAFSYQQYQRSLQLTDNTFDVGVRASIMKSTSRVRPFIGAGVAYRRGYINYDQNTQNYIKTYDPVGAQDVSISGFSGYIETGIDFKLTKNIGLYGMFRYYNTLSSSQSGPINPNAFITPYSGVSGLGYNNDVRNQAGTQLSKDNFYQLLGGVTVTF